MTHTAPITDNNPSVDEMEARVARFRALQPTDDYVDARIPGCERTTWRVLGTQPEAPLQAEDFHIAHFGDRDRAFRDRDRYSLSGRVAR